MIGVAIGLASAASPVYISEVAPPESRGRLVSFFQLAVTIGILVAYLVGLAFDGIEGWRWMLGLGCVPALALAFGMWRMPQSPRWLVMHGDDFKARAVLAKIRVDDPVLIEKEIEEIEESVHTDAKPGSWSDLLQPAVKAALVVGIGLAILQQVTGINTVIYYAPTIIEFTGVNSSAGSILAAVGVGDHQRRLHDRRDPPARQGGPAHDADDRGERHGDLAGRARRGLRRRRWLDDRLGRRDPQPDVPSSPPSRSASGRSSGC